VKRKIEGKKGMGFKDSGVERRETPESQVPVLAEILLSRKRLGGGRVKGQGNRIVVPHISIRVE